MSGCLDCAEKDKARNRELNNLITEAKKKAIETKKPKAVCEDQITGLFIAEAETAIQQHFLIRHIVSSM
jgi:hypothetical protein